ncbi:hypothetical protein [Metallibacterium sp.]|uniref:hypothetical protein n=1 Tax=Metallibacterium sp. TaxID=2940281 RepID=UPI002639F3AA|nr:hypothetical protein [Metallibacterium sp.]
MVLAADLVVDSELEALERVASRKDWEYRRLSAREFHIGLRRGEELLKLACARDYSDLGPNRVYLQLRGEPIFIAPTQVRQGCPCRDRSSALSLQVVGERHAHLLRDGRRDGQAADARPGAAA